MKTSVEAVDQTNKKSPATTDAIKQPPATSQTKFSAFYELWSDVIMPFLIIRLLLLLIGVVTIYYVLPFIHPHPSLSFNPRLSRFPDMLALMWDHFDSGFYLGIAQDGYAGANTLHSMSNWAFFPFYPILIRLVVLPFGSASYNTYRLAAIFVSNSAALIASIYLYKLTTRELDRTTAARTVLYLFLFPMSFYLSAVYPESLFLALVIACIYYARQHCWWLAGLLGGLATLTRPQGVLLVIIVGWEYLHFLTTTDTFQLSKTGRMAIILGWLHARMRNLYHSLSSWRTWLGFVWLSLIPGGLVLFSVYSKLTVGAFTAFTMVEKYGWRRELTNPLLVLQHAIQHPEAASPYDWNFYPFNMFIILAFFLLLIPIVRKLPLIYAIYTFAFLVMPLASGQTNSIARYYLPVFPVFILLALWSSRGSEEQQTRRHSFIVASFATLLALGMVLFTLGVYSLA